jgi:hypothetical protein
MIVNKKSVKKADYNSVLDKKFWEEKARPALLAKYMGFANKNSALKSGKESQRKRNMSIILENTRKALVSSNLTQNQTYIPKLVLPLITRCMPDLIAENLVSVQAISSPVGKIRALDFYRDGWDGSPDINIYPWTSEFEKRKHSEPMDHRRVTTDVLGTGDLTEFSGTLTNDPAEGTLFIYLEVGPAIFPIARIDNKTGDILQLIDEVNGTAFKLVGKFDPSSKSYSIYLSNAVATASDTIRFDYYLDWQRVVSYGKDDAAHLREGKNFNTVSPKVTSIDVTAKSRKIGTEYSYEAEEDWEAELGESFENRIVESLKDIISRELDSELLWNLYDMAVHTDTWNETMPAMWNQGSAEWYRTLMFKINKMAASIYQSTHIAKANWLVCSPLTAVLFHNMQLFTSTGNPKEPTGMSLNYEKIGNLQGLYDVYVSALVPDDEILLGWTGNKPEDTGMIYSPYIPIRVIPVPGAELLTLQIRTRYAITRVNGSFYGVISVTHN